jgi:Phosphotransferase enzyme family
MRKQADQATYRVMVFGRDGTEILLTRAHSGLRFPEVSIPKWERVAENVTSGMEREWGEIVVCLFEPELSTGASTSRYVAAKRWRTCATPHPPLQWMPVSDLAENIFSDHDDFRALYESLAQCGVSASDRVSGRFARLNWFEELCGWVSQAIAPKGLHLTGDFRQLNASPAFSLMRFETNGPAVWFKAVGEPNEREFPITLRFAKTFPRYAAEFVAERSDWKGWLTLEAKGSNLAETTDLCLWTQAASALARLQIESIEGCGPLLDSGAHDLSLGTLDKVVSPFLDVIARLMCDQTKIPPPTISDEGLAVLGERTHEAISRLSQSEIPDTLGHLDLNPGNIIVARDGCVFLDWAEAFVGHPFYSFQYLLQHFRRLAGEDPEAEQAVTTAYLRPWMEIVPSESITESMVLAPLLAVFAYGAGSDAWHNDERLRDPRLAGYLRALARRMNHEADQLSERNALCLS